MSLDKDSNVSGIAGLPYFVSILDQLSKSIPEANVRAADEALGTFPCLAQECSSEEMFSINAPGQVSILLLLNVEVGLKTYAQGILRRTWLYQCSGMEYIPSCRLCLQSISMFQRSIYVIGLRISIVAQNLHHQRRVV
jgi:hypothetical protein